jgi:hypothetical protein
MFLKWNLYGLYSAPLVLTIPLKFLAFVVTILLDPHHLQTQLWRPAIVLAICNQNLLTLFQTYAKYTGQPWHLLP